MSPNIHFWHRHHKQVKRVAAVSIAFFGLQALFFNAAPSDSASTKAKKKFVAGQILVQAKAGVSDERLAEILSKHHGKSKKHLKQIRTHVAEVAAGSEEAAVAALSANPEIKFAELDQLVPLAETTNDSLLGSEWHIAMMGAPAAWDVTHGDGIIIAILDSGVDANHPDLTGRLVAGYNFYDGNTNTMDVYGHGTKVAGTAAAFGNNGVGVAGVAWNARIMPLRISDLSGWATFSNMASAITYAADNGARVANISYQAHLSTAVESAAQYMINKGGLVVNSAGNSGVLESNAASDTLITVAATDSADNRAGFSTFGPFVDVSAPGVGVYTTVMGGGYGGVNGTSFASPATAGVVALMMAANKTLPPAQIRNLLFTTAKDRGDIGWDQYYGWGRVDAAAAVRAAASVVAVDSQAPTVSFSGLSSGSIVRGIASINASASDNIAVSRVELYNGSTLVGSDTVAPFSFSLDTTTVADGNLPLTLKAVDSSGNSASSSISVSVRNTVDTTAPVISSLNPADGATLGRNSASISAAASDNVGISSMVIYVDGVQKAASSSGSVSLSLNTRKMSSGLHTIRVDAVDTSGNTASKTISVKK